MQIANLTPFGLTWEFTPGSIPASGFSLIAFANSIQYNRDILIHSIGGSGFIQAASVGAFPYGSYVLIDRDDPLTTVLNVNNQITSIIFGLTALANTTSGSLKVDLNGQVHYRQPILVPAGKKISAYVMANNSVISNGRGLFTILAEVL